MKITITYDLPTAHGNLVRHIYVTESFEEAEDICKSIHDIGYILVDVTREE